MAGSRTMHDTEEREKDERASRWGAIASGASDLPTGAEKAATEAAAPKPKAPTIGERAAYGAGAVGGAVKAGVGQTFASAGESTEALIKGFKDLVAGTGPAKEDKGRGALIEGLSSLAGRVVGGANVASGLVGILSSPLSGVKAAAEKWVSSLPPEQQNAVALPEGQLVRELMGGGGAGPMTVKELAGHIAVAATIAHGALGEKGAAGEKPGEPAAKPGAAGPIKYAGAKMTDMGADAEPPAEAPARLTDPGPAPSFKGPGATLKIEEWAKKLEAFQKQDQAERLAASQAAELKSNTDAADLQAKAQTFEDVPSEGAAEIEAMRARRAAQGTVPPAEAKGVEPVPEAETPQMTELQASLKNPHGIIAAPPEQMPALAEDIKAEGINPVPAQGKSTQLGDEASFIAQGISREKLEELGNKYGQQAVIYGPGEGTAPAEMRYLAASETPGKVVPQRGKTAFGEGLTDNYTDVGGARFAYDFTEGQEGAPPSEQPQAPGQGSPAEEAAAPAATPPAVAAPEAPSAPQPPGTGEVPPGPAAEAPTPAAAPDAPQEGAPAAAEGGAVAQPEPAAEPGAPEAITPSKGVLPPEEEEPATEAATPPPQTIADVHNVVGPPAEQAANEAATEVQRQLQVREAGKALAQRLRAAGASRAEINEAMRAYLNENGIQSKNQLEAAKGAPKELDKAAIRQGLADIRAKIAEINNKLGQQGAMKFSADGRALTDISGALKSSKELWNELTRVGAGLLHTGARTLKDWSAEMLTQVGDQVKPVLKELYPLAQAQYKVLNDKYDLPNMKSLYKAMVEGQPGYGWYDEAPGELAQLGTEPGKNGMSNADTFAGTYAATSPLSDASSTNMDRAWNAYNQIVSGEKDGRANKFEYKTGEWGMANKGIVDNLNRVARGERVTGPKVSQFEGQLRQDAMTSGARDVPVIDTWMYRAFGMVGEDGISPMDNEANRQLAQTVIQKMSRDSGVSVPSVQAMLWTEIKGRAERAKAIEDAKDFGISGKEDLARELAEINEKNGTPFQQLLRNRLGPELEAARMGQVGEGAGVQLLSRKVTAALMEDPADPVNSATVAAEQLGLDYDSATKVAESTVDNLRSAGMDDGAGGINFQKQPGTPYDRVQANRALAEKERTLCP